MIKLAERIYEKVNGRLPAVPGEGERASRAWQRRRLSDCRNDIRPVVERLEKALLELAPHVSALPFLQNEERRRAEKKERIGRWDEELATYRVYTGFGEIIVWSHKFPGAYRHTPHLPYSSALFGEYVSGDIDLLIRRLGERLGHEFGGARGGLIQKRTTGS